MLRDAFGPSNVLTRLYFISNEFLGCVYLCLFLFIYALALFIYSFVTVLQGNARLHGARSIV